MQTAVFGRLTALADPTRSRLLLVLERHELTVGELCAVLQLPQSTVSRHLKVLGDEGWVTARAEGTTRRYAMRRAGLDPAARQLWRVVRGEVAALRTAAHDADRLRSVLAERHARSQAFFSSAAGHWDRLRAELFGTHAELAALPALLDDDWAVGDLGCGTGQVAAALAPFVRQVIAVDESPAMLAAARARLGGMANVAVRPGGLEQLPIDDGELDAAILSLVLHHVPEPERALAEVARAVRPGGRLVVLDMLPHEREEYRQTMGHAWLGFGEETLGRWLEEAGFGRLRFRPLPPSPDVKGPTLFAASARRLNPIPVAASPAGSTHHPLHGSITA